MTEISYKRGIKYWEHIPRGNRDRDCQSEVIPKQRSAKRVEVRKRFGKNGDVAQSWANNLPYTLFLFSSKILLRYIYGHFHLLMAVFVQTVAGLRIYNNYYMTPQT